MTKTRSCHLPPASQPPRAWIDLCLFMTSWRHTQTPAVASALPCAGWRGRICLHQRLLMLPQPGAQPKERAVNTNTRCLRVQRRSLRQRAGIARDATSNTCYNRRGLSRNGSFPAATQIAPRSVTAGRNKSIKNEGKQGGWVMGLNQRVH